MPVFKAPDPESLLSVKDGVGIYSKDIRENYPLYRGIKIVGATPIMGNRRVAHLTWIVHQARFVRGGDAWTLQQQAPDVLDRAAAVCADVFDRSYLRDTFDYTEAELDALVKQEKDKYT